MNRAILRVSWDSRQRLWSVVRGSTVGFSSPDREAAEREAVQFGQDMRPALVLIEDADGEVIKTIRC